MFCLPQAVNTPLTLFLLNWLYVECILFMHPSDTKQQWYICDCIANLFAGSYLFYTSSRDRATIEFILSHICGLLTNVTSIFNLFLALIRSSPTPEENIHIFVYLASTCSTMFSSCLVVSTKQGWWEQWDWTRTVKVLVIGGWVNTGGRLKLYESSSCGLTGSHALNASAAGRLCQQSEERLGLQHKQILCTSFKNIFK